MREMPGGSWVPFEVGFEGALHNCRMGTVLRSPEPRRERPTLAAASDEIKLVLPAEPNASDLVGELAHHLRGTASLRVVLSASRQQANPRAAHPGSDIASGSTTPHYRIEEMSSTNRRGGLWPLALAMVVWTTLLLTAYLVLS
jgi:hypothetical protein